MTDGYKNKSDSPVRVVHIVGAMYPGGMGNYIMNLYRNMDRSKVQFDFMVHTRRENDYVEQVKAMGARVYELPRLTGHPVRNLRMIKKIIREENIDVAIRHTANALITPQLLAAKHAGAVTICHSHSTTDPQMFLHKLGRLFMKSATTERYACSDAAGRWMYGSLDYRVINNAIDLEEFAFSMEKRKKIRDELPGALVRKNQDSAVSADSGDGILNIEKCHVYGHVGNFSEVKNHTFLLKVFRKILDRDPDSFLVCVGEGALRDDIEREIRELGLENNVILTGIRRDVGQIMSAMDLLIFPSIYEGLPLTLIEAQAAGLPCLISDVITDDVNVTKEGLVQKASLNDAPDMWAEKAVAIANQRDADEKLTEMRCRPEIRSSIAEHGYDLKRLSEWFEKHMIELGDGR